MFRLTQKGKQSHQNHRIINQTTKISSDPSSVSSTSLKTSLAPPPDPSPTSGFFSLQSKRAPTSNCAPIQKALNVPKIEMISDDKAKSGSNRELEDLAAYVDKMRHYQSHMARLEEQNAALQRENNFRKMENISLKTQLAVTEKYYAASAKHSIPMRRQMSMPPDLCLHPVAKFAPTASASMPTTPTHAIADAQSIHHPLSPKEFPNPSSEFAQRQQ